jgi:hypothetical protein
MARRRIGQEQLGLVMLGCEGVRVWTKWLR